MKTKTLLLAILTFCSVNVISQIIHVPGDQPTIQEGINAAENGETVLVNEVLTTKSVVAYGYVGYDGTGGLPIGPCVFDLDDPGTITSLAPGTSGNFIAAGTWADGKWYGEEWGVGNLYEINPNDGSMTFIGSSGLNIAGLAFNGTIMYACAVTNFYSINIEDGTATYIGPMGNNQFMVGMACDSSGNIYGADVGDDNLYSIDPATGTATVIGPLGIDIEFAQDLEFDKDNDILYLSGFTTTGALYTVDPDNGTATLVAGFMNGCLIDGLAIPYGSTVFANDVGILYISSPSSGMVLTDEEEVIVLIKNFGSTAQSNFDVFFTVDGGTPVTETITATINSGETYEYTFTATVDLSVYGSYAFEICTDLAGDENPDNNCNTKIVVNSELDYCDASTDFQDEWIANVLCGSINNPSDWQGGVADYTDITTTIEPGMSEDITVTNGNPYVNDFATVWVDWNNDTVFQINSDEEFILLNDGTGELFTGSIEVPAGTTNGEHRMRIRLFWNLTPGPCGVLPLGEVEDYTIVVDGVTNLKAYGYVAYDPTGELPQGPCFFNLDDPDTITSLAPGTSENFIAAGTWADGKWYGEEWGVGNLYEINPYDGSMTLIGSSGLNIAGLAYDGSTMYACSGTNFFSINLVDGAATYIGAMGNQQFMVGMACDSAGKLYGVDIYDDNLYSINSTSGDATIIGPLGIDLDEYAQDMDFDKDNHILYLAGLVNGVGALYTIDPVTGTASFAAEFMNEAEIDAFAIPYGGVVIPNDLGIVSIVSPSSGVDLTAEEPVIVLINNFGTNTQSNFDVSFTLDGGTAVTETITATINGGETYLHTFTTTIDLSAYGDYAFEACTDLTGDENTENDCMSTTIENLEPYLCSPEYATGCSLGDGFSDFALAEIENYGSGCADLNGVGWSQYLNLGPAVLTPGVSYDITMATNYTNNFATVWIDFDDNLFFDETEIVVNNFEMVYVSQLYTVPLDIPVDAPAGNHIMRARTNWDNPCNDPCALYMYGEAEDYTIVVDDITNIDINLLNATQVYPNPASDFVNIKSDVLLKSVKVFNQIGQVVINMQLNSNFYRLNTAMFKSGIYLFRVETDEGIISKRVVIN